MARCRSCGNTSHFNVWCCIQKVLEVELDEHDDILEIMGEPEDETLHGLEEVELMEGDLSFSMVGCAICGGNDIDINGQHDVLSLRIYQ